MKVNDNVFNTNYLNFLYGTINDAFNNHLKNMIDTKVVDLDIYGFVTKEPVTFSNKEKYELREFQINESWGKLFDCAWFNIKGTIINFNKQEDYYLKLDLSGEALLFNNNGVPVKGFTNGSSAFDLSLGEPGKAYYKINEFIDDNNNIDLWVDAGANDLFGNLSLEGRIQEVKIVTRNSDALKLYYDFETLYSLLQALDQNTTRYKELLEGLLDASHLVIYKSSDYINKTSHILEELLSKKTSSSGEFFAIGHGHMDLAWLWPIRETKRKVARLFTNVISNLKTNPNYVFGVSQPQMLVWLKEDYKELYDQVKEYILEGRIELQGGMWVESDTNLASGEALVRQMLYGIKYYEEEFNFRVKNLWLPDVFGYSGNLPQIIKKSGLDSFMTIKISWNMVNRFPHHTFNWEGIDGSKVLTHMPPEGTYNSPSSPLRNYHAWNEYIEKDIAPKALIVYGIGDGGGGPGDEHLERINRQSSLDPLPKVKYSRADEFFVELEDYKDLLPIYQGELYLENHQGTYTSQSNIKKMNRLLEEKLKSIETVLTLNNMFNSYKDEFNEIWKEVLLYQFHDILPGSSIKRVYDEAIIRYDILSKQLDNIFNKAFSVNNNGIDYLLNPLNYSVRKLIKDKESYNLYLLEPFSSSKSEEIYTSISYKENIFETNSLIITIDLDTGFISSLIYKPLNLELANESSINELRVYKDYGDAWNIQEHYRKQEHEYLKLVKQEFKDYSIGYEIVQEYIFKNSKLTQTIFIDKETDEININHNVDWQDLKYMLRSSSRVNVNSDIANFDIQFGEISRPRTNNDSYDTAMFEVPGQQWASINDSKVSFSIINDSKYGYYVKDNYLDMNLLRSTDHPANNGDIGETNYNYQFIISNKNHHDLQLDRKGIIYNTYYPIIDKEIRINNFIEFNNDNIEISAIKESYNNNDIIIRLYEKNGTNTILEITRDTKIDSISITNLVEEDIKVLESNVLDFTPFEVKTLRIKL